MTRFYQTSAAALTLYNKFELIFGQSKCLATVDSSTFQCGKIFGFVGICEKAYCIAPVFKIQHRAYTLSGTCIVLNDFVMLDTVKSFQVSTMKFLDDRFESVYNFDENEIFR